MTRLVITRHGQSIANAEYRFAGHSDFDLSEIGKAQAELTSQYICAHEKIDVIYSSDLLRAYNTAVPTAKNLGLEIIPTEGFYDYENKYQAGKTKEICPAQISESLKEKLSEQTLLAFKTLRLSGYARFDFLADESETTYCLEANTLPGMTPTSLLPQMAAAVGISYGKLCTKIIETALN